MILYVFFYRNLYQGYILTQCHRVPLCHGSSYLALKFHFPIEFSFHLNQIPLNKPIQRSLGIADWLVSWIGDGAELCWTVALRSQSSRTLLVICMLETFIFIRF